MDVFSFRDRLIDEYAVFSRSFTRLAAADIREFVDTEYRRGAFWPSPIIQLNPNFVQGSTTEALVADGVLDPQCGDIFRLGKSLTSNGVSIPLHKHQEDAIRIARTEANYVLTTGTGSGKSLSYFIPIVDWVLRAKKENAARPPSIAAIVIYPMNALCNSQRDELRKFLCEGFREGGEPVRFARYTGQETQQERDDLARHPPDILLTNYMMLELILTRQNETDKAVVRSAAGLKFLVLDELHTYRGRQGADVALLIRRVRQQLNRDLVTVGTSATMVSDGPSVDQRQIVASVATRLFGSPVKAQHVVTETLERVTPAESDLSATGLAAAIRSGFTDRASFDDLLISPLAAWIELNLGLDLDDGKWVRTRSPKTVEDAATKLASDSGCEPGEALQALKHFLLLAYNAKSPAGRSLFAFRLHQFISGAGDVFATLEADGRRHLTLNAQRFQPSANREKLLFNLCFCRECGQEYAPVWATMQGKSVECLEPRELADRSTDDQDARFGFFMPDPSGRFDAADIEGSYPQDWIDYAGTTSRLKPSYRNRMPIRLLLDPSGKTAAHGSLGWFIPGTFRFCLNPDCRVSYDASVRSDLTKLASLSSEGRSSATTVLTLSVLRYLLRDSENLSKKAKKLLGFTDNRQDASLQAGHFNDFIQILLLRGALLAAIEEAPGRALTDGDLTQRVFEHLRLADADYFANPAVKGIAAEGSRLTLRDVLGYRLYFDLRRGWRITNPNLEQLGLLKIDYRFLDDCCRNEEAWSAAPDLLARSSAEVRKRVAELLLDTMRRRLCIKTRYLEPFEQEQIRNRSHTNLREPWGLSEDERLEPASVMIPQRMPPNWKGEYRVEFASFRSRLGRSFSQRNLWRGVDSALLPAKFTEEHFDRLINDLFRALSAHGLVEPVDVKGLGTGHRVCGNALRWVPTDGADASRAAGSRVTDNRFFRELYRSVAELLREGDRVLHVLEAREHTAQVDPDERQKREDRFRSADLPVLYCSPTMELGVDIAELNSVYMRNIPPTPANYAQRSGRAGRSGQPALVVAYAAAKSPHDQYFFRSPRRMVSGSVNPPTLDLASEDLIRSHLHAVWLAETRQQLGSSVTSVLDVEKPSAELPVRDALATAMTSQLAKRSAIDRGEQILAMLANELDAVSAPWFSPDWLNRTLDQAYSQFDHAFDRWRTLYRATRQQMERAQKIINSAAASTRERDEAKRRHDDAYVQQKLLLESRTTMNSDFNTYRYLASQGFLPGYNFPRLPLLAFVPARREKVGRDSFLSRPRFLALSEFGPRSIIYHEGSQYRVTKAILSIRDEDSVSVEAKLPVREARLCPACGYGHFGPEAEAERCISCETLLEGGLHLKTLYRVDNVSTRRVTRITSDEEERQRQGYETQTTLQFAEKNGALQVIRGVLRASGEDLLDLQYGPAATVWRINLGWRRRKEKKIFGFNIDVVTGRWTKDAQAPETSADDDQSEGKIVPQRIVPFVEDRRNVLVISPKERLQPSEMATLQNALKRGIEREFQLEEAELMAEPLPDAERRNAILFYEAAEGGAGVLTRLAVDPNALRRVAARALEMCHYEKEGPHWQADHLIDTDAECEAGCYRCLLSYYNQPDHLSIDRRSETVRALLCRLTEAALTTGSEGRSPDEHLDELSRLSGSSLEHAWLHTVKQQGYRLPDRAQRLIQEHATRPDFEYVNSQTLIYVDGPHHQNDEQKRLDLTIAERLEDAGYTVIRFASDQRTWPAIFARFPDVFGKAAETVG